jgi:hypothetical protein
MTEGSLTSPPTGQCHSGRMVPGPAEPNTAASGGGGAHEASRRSSRDLFVDGLLAVAGMAVGAVRDQPRPSGLCSASWIEAALSRPLQDVMRCPTLIATRCHGHRRPSRPGGRRGRPPIAGRGVESRLCGIRKVRWGGKGDFCGVGS